MPKLYAINARKKFALYLLLLQFVLMLMAGFGLTNSAARGTMNGPSPNAVPTVSASFSNSSQITINTVGVIPSPASPYPSNIPVKGVFGEITSLTVSLSGLSHSYPDDIDVLLVGPQGQTAILMSDAGGLPAVSNLNLTFDDTAANSLPDFSQLTSGTYKPTNYGSGDSWPSPAPVGPYGDSLSSFIGPQWGLETICG